MDQEHTSGSELALIATIIAGKITPDKEDGQSVAAWMQQVFMPGFYQAMRMISGGDSYRRGIKELADDFANSTTFVAKVTGVDFEETSQRYVISLAGEQRDKNGQVVGEKEEQIRTERVDGPLGWLAEMHARMAERLIGKFALIRKRSEDYSRNGRTGKVRVLVDIALARSTKKSD